MASIGGDARVGIATGRGRERLFSPFAIHPHQPLVGLSTTRDIDKRSGIGEASLSRTSRRGARDTFDNGHRSTGHCKPREIERNPQKRLPQRIDQMSRGDVTGISNYPQKVWK